MKGLISTIAILLATTASANTINNLVLQLNREILKSDDVVAQGLEFKVGDTANYTLNMGGFINGSMLMEVKSVAADEVVIAQNMDLGFLGKQACEETINPNTGEIKKMVCNGQNQDPKSGNYEVIDTKEDTVTVPAGTFTCLYIKAKDTESNQEAEQWVSPKQIPVFGLVKMNTSSQMGPVKVELKSFKKN